MAARGIGVTNALVLTGACVLLVTGGCTLVAEFPGGPAVPTPTAVPVVTVPAPVRATAGIDSILLDWPPVPGAFAYNVYLAGIPGVTPQNYAQLPGGAAFRSVFPPLRLDAANGIIGGIPRYAVVTSIAPDAETGRSAEVRVVPLASGLNSLFSVLPGGMDEGDQANAQLGWSVADAGDLNADGRRDFVSGAFLYSATQANEGRVTVYLGGTSGLLSAGSLDGGLANASFGMGLEPAGDMNGDGYDDLWIGAPYNALNGTGFVELYAGGAQGVGEPLTRIEASDLSAQVQGHFGRSLASLDMDGDGRRDLVIGADNWDYAPNADCGAAYVYLTPPAGFPSTPVSSMAGGTLGDGYAFNVEGVGDLNGDGYEDLVVGQINGAESIFVFEGAATLTGNPDAEDFRFAGPDQSAYGAWTAAAGDVNGDGFDDFVTGAHVYDNGGTTNSGEVELWLGQDASPAVLFSGFRIRPTVADAQFGRQVETGDVNGDGHRDLLVGARGLNGGTPSGRLFAYPGVPGGFSTTNVLTLQDSQAGTEYGHAFHVADFNGDGSDDILVGSPRRDSAVAVDAGAVFLYYGPPNRGPTADAGPPINGIRFTEVHPTASFVDPAPPGTTQNCFWNWGDGPEVPINCSQIGMLSHTYSQTGTFDLTLRVENVPFGLSGMSVSRAVIAP